ncbi:F0F1 ATP synthase subunit delta [Neobacillus mesonae]|nr:F0F1 ATP synthase subunit delta [Neobacillus mesonae]
MSQDTVVAKRYAKALFDVAIEKQSVLEVEAELRAVASSIAGDRDILKFITSPNVSVSAKLSVINSSLREKVSEPVLNTINLLIERRRIQLLDAVVDSYLNLEADALGMVNARVYSTYELNEEEKLAVQKEFGERINKQIRIENIIDTSLIGGLKVVVGDTIYDGSLAGQLKRIEQSFSRRV